MLGFVEEGKPKSPEKNPRKKARTNNSVIGGRRALSPLLHPCAPCTAFDTGFEKVSLTDDSIACVLRAVFIVENETRNLFQIRPHHFVDTKPT